jgi:hypothetical protein
MAGERDRGRGRVGRYAPISGPGTGVPWGSIKLFVAGLTGYLALGLALLLGVGWLSDEGGSGAGSPLLGEPQSAVIETAPLPRRDVAAALGAFRAPAGLPTLSEVPIADQGIALHRPLQPNVYLLQQMSTGRYITDNGRLVLVDDSGRRLLAAPTAQSD